MRTGTSENGSKTTPLRLKFSSIMISSGTLDGTDHNFSPLRGFKASLFEHFWHLIILVSYFVMHLNLQWFIFMLPGIWLLRIKSILRIFGFRLLLFWWHLYQECIQFSTWQETGLKRSMKWNEKLGNSRLAKTSRNCIASTNSTPRGGSSDYIFRIDSVKLRKMELI